MGNLAGQWTYTYDHAGRVASIVPPNPVPEQGLGGDYGYDWLGQLTNPPADPNHLTYNSAGQLSAWPGMYSYTYKSNGMPYQVKNPSGTMVIASCAYSAAGFPREFTTGDITTQCEWDAEGTLLGYAQTAGGTESQSELIDPTMPNGPVLMDDVSGSTVSYVCDPQGYVVASASDNERVDYHRDASGEFGVSTASSGAIVPTYAYGPDGEVVSTSDPLGDRIAGCNEGLLFSSLARTSPWSIGDVWDGIVRVIGGRRGDFVDTYLNVGSDFWAGMGDTISGGLTNDFRRLIGVDDAVHYGSTAHTVGRVGGYAWHAASLFDAGAILLGRARIPVTTWAPRGVQSTLVSGRWVTLGTKNPVSYFSTLTWLRGYPYANAITEYVLIRELGLVPGWSGIVHALPPFMHFIYRGPCPCP